MKMKSRQLMFERARFLNTISDIKVLPLSYPAVHHVPRNNGIVYRSFSLAVFRL